MVFEAPDSFRQFALLDSGLGYRLEKWNNVVLVRPDPQALWQRRLSEEHWNEVDAVFSDGWQVKNAHAFTNWSIQWQDVQFKLKLTHFKHVGLFPEQAAHWSWLVKRLATVKRKQKILNLFAYTGGATMVIAQQGHHVTHVDASKPAIRWAQENQRLNSLPQDAIRWILDDASAFVRRELRRGVTYDGIILDPPAFGHAPSGKTWEFSADISKLLEDCLQLLSPTTGFLIVNSYATNMSSIGLYNLMQDAVKDKNGTLDWGELCLKEERLLSTGCFVRYSIA